TFFEICRAEQILKREDPWAPFVSEKEWEFAEWVIGSGISQQQTDKLLKTMMVSLAAQLKTGRGKFTSFHDNKTFLHTVDSLPGPRASWKLIEISVKGTLRDSKGNLLKEKLDVWGRDPVEVLADLAGNPDFKDEISWEPFEEIVEGKGESEEEGTQERIFEEM
ncbi:hypothetical protein JAAARDRAFT_105405, partial [Jaapia argillacea MUCL 33604]